MKLYWQHIQSIAKAHHMEDPTGSTENFARFLKWWWCRTFNRPMKDPLLAQYSFHELCYEFLRYYYLDPQNDPKKELEAKSVKEDEDEWLKAQMGKIAEANQAKVSATEPVPAPESSPVESLPDEIEESIQSMADLPDISSKFDE